MVTSQREWAHKRKRQGRNGATGAGATGAGATGAGATGAGATGAGATAIGLFLMTLSPGARRSSLVETVRARAVVFMLDLDTRLAELMMGTLSLVVAWQVISEPSVGRALPFLNSALRVLHMSEQAWFVGLALSGGAQIIAVCVGWKRCNFLGPRAHACLVAFVVFMATVVAILTAWPLTYPTAARYGVSAMWNLLIACALMARAGHSPALLDPVPSNVAPSNVAPSNVAPSNDEILEESGGGVR